MKVHHCPHCDEPLTDTEIYYKQCLTCQYEWGEQICDTCGGSGEGRADGTRCITCKGLGVIKPKMEEEV